MNTILRQYQGYVADKRMSMDIYAIAMSNVVNNNEFKLELFRPSSRLERFANSRLVMRYLRYWHYPKEVKSKPADLHHVMDHGYAHLQPYLKPLKSTDESPRTCITVHDVIPLLTWNGNIKNANGEAFVVRKPWLNLKSNSYLLKYDRLLAVSQSTKSDIVNHLGIDANKVEIIPPIISDVFKPSSLAMCTTFRQKYNLDQECVWLMISGSEFYKNHKTSLEVLQHLNQNSNRDFRLIKTGVASQEFNFLVKEMNLESQVRTLFLDDTQELASLYTCVDCLLFPSLYEGFGMPVAEALGCGTPAIISDRGALPEVGGDLTPMTDAGDVQGFARLVLSLLEDKNQQLKIYNEGPEWVKRYRPESIEPKLIKFYQNTLSNN